LINQLPKVFDISIESAGPLRNLWRVGQEIGAGHANWNTFAVGAATFALILLLRRFRRIPGVLVAVAAATIAVGVLGLETTAGVKVLGPLPQGLPSFAVPWVGLADLGAVAIGGCAAALVSIADTSIFSRVYAARTRTSVDPNQEMVGLGAAN